MENQQKLDILNQVWELFETVREGADYLAEHPENPQLRRDTAAGLRALHAHLSAVSPIKNKTRGGG